MSKVILVTGGARSGKSGFAESLCKNQNNSTAYIATSVAFDDEMKERVRKHQASRPKEWKTYEIYKDIYKIIKDISEKHQTVILDCITLLVNNLMFTDGIDIDNASEEEINEFCKELPRYKRPRKIIFAKVPRNATGKIEKPKLREIYHSKNLVDAQNRG